MTLDTIVVWVIIGGVAGLLADAFVKGVHLGVVGAILVGILGAFIGGWLFGLLHISIGAGIIGEIITAFIGAVVLLLFNAFHAPYLAVEMMSWLGSPV